MLPVERRLFDGNELSIGRVEDVLTSDRFDDFGTRLAEQSQADPLARQAADLHRRRLSARLEKVGPLASFACGHGICVGTIDVGDRREAYEDFVAGYLGQGNDASAPDPGVMMDYPMEDADGGMRARFIMTIDPALDSVSLRGSRPGPRR